MGRWLKRLLWVVVSCLIVVCIAMGALLVAYQSGVLARWIKQHYAGQVHFTIEKQSWYGGSPSIDLSHVVLLSPETHKPVLMLEKAHIAISIWRSLFHLSPVTSQLVLKGLTVDLVEDAHAQYHLTGWPVNRATKVSAQGGWTWLKWQRSLSVENVNVHIRRYTGRLIELKNLHLIWQETSLGSYALHATLRVPQAGDASLLIGVGVHHPDTLFTSPDVELSLRMKAGDFGPIFQLLPVNGYLFAKGGGDVDIKAHWQKGHVEVLNSKVALSHFVVSMRKHGGAPLDAIVSADALTLNSQYHSPRGMASLSVKNATIQAKALFNQSPAPVSLQAKFSLEGLAQGWVIGLTQFVAKTLNISMNASGKLTTAAPFSQSTLSLHSTVLGHDLGKETLRLVPKMGVSEGLYGWLHENIHHVQQASIKMDVSGRLDQFPYETHPGQFLLDANVTQGELTPYKGWPLIRQVNGELQFSNAEFAATVRHAVSEGMTLKSGHLSINNMLPGIPADLVVKTDLNGASDGISQYVMASPLKETLAWYSQVTLSHPLALDLNLTFPLAQPEVPNIYKGKIHFKDNAIAPNIFPAMAISNLTGDLSFNGFDLSTQGLQGQLMGHPATVSIKPDAMHVDAMIDFDWLKKHSNQPIFKSLSGKTPITMKKKGSALTIDSSFAGVESKLPAPFYKPADVNMPLAVRWENNSQLTASFGEVFALKASLMHQPGQWHLTTGVGRLGKVAMPKPIPNQLSLAVKLPYLSMNDWSPLYQHISVNGKGSLISRVSLLANIEDLFAFNTHFLNTTVGAARSEEGIWDMTLTSDRAKGHLHIPNDINQFPIVAKMDYLHLVPIDTATMKKASGLIDKVNVVYSLPPLMLTVEDLYFGDKEVGLLSLSSRPSTNGIVIHHLNWINSNVHLSMKGDIKRTPTNDLVKLTGNSTGKNYGKALAQLGYPHILSLTKGNINFVLSWSGKLAKPDLKTLNGWVGFDLKDGVLSNVNPGISRLLGLFSLEALSRRLSFDFNDLTEKGLAFNTVKGRYDLKNGIATTKNVELVGPALDLNLKGDINIPEQTMDQTVVVMPHMDSGIAIAATILGGPIVGVATWVADHVLSNTLLKGHGLVYQLSGSWEKPNFKIKHKHKEKKK